MDVTEMSVHLRILILLAALSSAAAGNLVINPVGEAHTRALGTSIVFTCSVMGIPPNVKPELRWTDGEGKDITNTQGTVYIEKDGEQSLKLYITSIVANDAGDYSCSGIIEGNRVTLKTTLLLYKDITFDDAPALQYPRIYTDALIKCRVSGQPVPTVTWRHGGEKIQTGGRYENEIDGLRIMNITEEDNGRYICRAEVAAEGRLKEKQIDVEAHIPPKITEKMKDMEEIEDHNVTLRCKASGKPDPKYEFYKDGVDAPLFSKNHVIVDGSRGMIHFVPLNKIDEGTYSCKAINDVGTDTTGAKLKVIVRPTIWELRDTQAEEGKQGRLLCKSSGDPPPEMTWRKSPHNDYDYSNGPNEGGRIIVQKVNPGELELVINNVTPDDTSNYTCSATNQGGNDKKNGTFAAQFSPRFDPNHPNVVYSWAGKTRNVTCIALGEPEPHIRWYRKNDLIDQKNETFRDYSEGRVGKLQITVRDGNQHWIFDQYICRAINEFGQKELAIQLQRATVPDKPRSVEVLDSSPTMVELAVTPPLENGGVEVYGFRVEFMDGIQDFNLGQDIRLENLKPSTTYIFSIRAKNEVGVSDVLDYVYQTEAIREPYPIVIISDPESRYSYSYDIRWELPRTGGLPIKEYWFKYRRVSVYEGTWDFQKPLEDFTKLEVQDNPQTPMMFFTLEGLKPNAYYQVEVIAHNDIGESIARPFIFRTKEGAEPLPAQKEVTLGTGAIIGVVIAVFFLFLIIVDVSCFFMNDCGLLMCVCVHLCGKQQPGSKERAMEEGDSKRIAEKPPIQETKVVPEEGMNAQAQAPMSQIQALNMTPRTIWKNVMQDLRDRLKEEDEEEDSVRLKDQVEEEEEEEPTEKSPLTAADTAEAQKDVEQGQEATEVKVADDHKEAPDQETPREGDAN